MMAKEAKRAERRQDAPVRNAALYPEAAARAEASLHGLEGRHEDSGRYEERVHRTCGRLRTQRGRRDRDGATREGDVQPRPDRHPLPRRERGAFRRLAYLLLPLSVLGLPGCLQDMWVESRVQPLSASRFFADDRSSRAPVYDTVSREATVMPGPFDTGMKNGKPIDYFPISITRAVIDRGEERFNIYCSPCHGRTGYGNGMIVQRGFTAPPSYHIPRLRAAPVGQFFDVMTNGYGEMYSYADRVDAADRWAIAVWIRVLQRSQDAAVVDVPPGAAVQLARSGS